MDLYLGIGDMPIYNFDKILKTNNLAYVVVGYNGRGEIEVPENAQKQWDVIYNEYCKKTVNNEALTFYSLSCEVGYLEMRYMAIISLIENLCEEYKKEIGLRLNKWGVPFNVDGSIKKQLPQLKTQLRIAKQKIDLKNGQLNALKNDDDSGPVSLLKQVIVINEQLGVKIDIMNDSVEYFLEALDRLKEKLEQQKQARNG